MVHEPLGASQFIQEPIHRVGKHQGAYQTRSPRDADGMRGTKAVPHEAHPHALTKSLLQPRERRLRVRQRPVQSDPAPLPIALAMAPMIDRQGMNPRIGKALGKVSQFLHRRTEAMKEHDRRFALGCRMEFSMQSRAIHEELDRLHNEQARGAFVRSPHGLHGSRAAPTRLPHRASTGNLRRRGFQQRPCGRAVDALRAFRAEVESLLDAAVAKLAPDTARPSLENPPDPTMGELGMPCFPFARALRKAPPAIAQELAAAVEATGTEWVAEVRAVGPYVNFFLDTAKLARVVLSDPMAAITASPKTGKVLLEHTSANPNGPLHVGRARNPILGDTLARLHRVAGYDIETHYYMDNLGRQVALLYLGSKTFAEADLPPAARDKADHRLVRYYQAANERMTEDPEYAAEVKSLVARLETADPELLAGVRTVYEACFAGMSESLARLGVTFDSVDDESDHVADGTVEQVIQGLKASPRAAQEDDGANYLDLGTELEGNKSTKFFFTRRDQTSVYATRDVAYHKWKSDHVGPGGRLIDVLGEDHRLQSLQVGVALDELGATKPHVVFYAFVSLPEGKMSTRANRVVFVDDLLDEAVAMAREAVLSRRGDEMTKTQVDAIAEAVGIAAIRYNIAKVQPEKPIKFRWEEALDFEGDSAPYLMYAHARAVSLLAKAKAQNIEAAVHDEAIQAGEARLLSLIARLPSVAEDAADRAAPHHFCAYASELASAFNGYYRDHHVLDHEDADERATRLAVVDAARMALRRCHEALGLPALDTM